MSLTDRGSAPDEAKRRRNHSGWCWYDWANSVFPTSIASVFLSLYLTQVATAAAQEDFARNGVHACPGGNSLQQCDIALFGFNFPAGSLWGYLLSAATLVQVVVLPVTGAVADRAQNKRPILAVFVFTGAATTGLLALVGGTNWQLGSALFIVANICWGAAVVVYYSYLPEIATPDERDGLSARGWAFGYLGGGTALLLHLAIFVGHDAIGISEDAAVRLVFFSSGLWWAAFTLFPLTMLRTQRATEPAQQQGPVLISGFRQLGSTLRQARHLPLTLLFLAAYLIYTDGISTVSTVSAQYGSLELKLPQNTLIVTILIVQFVAYFGGVLHGLLAGRIGAKRTIMASLLMWVLVLGFAYFVQAGEPIQFYALAIGIGLVLGGTNALSRSLFSQMVPQGKEAQYFSLYELGERSTSWLGPLIFAGIGQATGSFRVGIISLTIFFALGLVLVAFVPARRAIEAAGNRAPEVV